MWVLDALAALVERCTLAMDEFDYATAKNEVEMFFWHDLADNYLEMAKARLYEANDPLADGARYTLHHALLTVLKLFAPFLPYVTDAVYREVFRDRERPTSIHITAWPVPLPDWRDSRAPEIGRALLEIAASVRRHKSDRSISLGAPIERLVVEVPTPVAPDLSRSLVDIRSVTRAREVLLTQGNGSQTTVTIPEG
jgi:valyl-tRNA synthetase